MSVSNFPHDESCEKRFPFQLTWTILEGRDNLTTASAAAAPEIADLTGDDDVQAVEAKPDTNEAPKIMW